MDPIFNLGDIVSFDKERTMYITTVAGGPEVARFREANKTELKAFELVKKLNEVLKSRWVRK
jgi:hypothetical protein